MKPSKADQYLRSQKVLKAGIGGNDAEARAWWYGEEKYLSIYIESDTTDCHWANISRRAIEKWLASGGKKP